MRGLSRTLAGVGAAAALAGGVLAGCFSERDGTAPAPTEECRVPVGEGVPGSTVVVIRQFAFESAAVRVQAGGRVTWVNCEERGDAHTSTSDAGVWSSPLLAPGNAFTQTFSAPGEFPYHCEPHPFMTGVVIVE